MRLSKLSSSEKVFKKIKGPYEEALKKSGHLGHEDVLKFTPKKTIQKEEKKKSNLL